MLKACKLLICNRLNISRKWGPNLAEMGKFILQTANNKEIT